MAKKIRIIPELDESKLRQQLNNIGKRREKITVGLDDTNINNADQSMKRLNSTVSSSNTVFAKLKSAISNTFSSGKLAMTGYLAVLNEINKAGKNAKQTIQEIDKAVTDLSVATNMSRESVSGLIRDYNDYAKELKSTTTQITSAADDYLRAGKSMSETQALIKDSIMLSKLGQLESGAATEDLLATMNGYEMSVEEVGKALDAMVAIDMEAATSAGDIATALKYSASSADMAGLSFNKLAAMIGTVQDKTQQSAEIIGAFMNTLLSRYRNVKIGQFVSDDGEDLSEVETILDSLDIKLRDSSQEFRSFETVIEEVALSWDNYSSVQQAAIAKAFSGTRQQNRFLALMEGYSKVLELTEVAADSAGTALDKFNNSYMNSLEAKQNALQASFESMVMNSDFSEVYAGILDATTALVDFINQTNALKGVLTGLTVAGGIKGFLAIKTGINEAYITLNKFQNALNIVKKTNISTQEFGRLLSLSNGLSKNQMKLVLSTNALSVAQKKDLLVASGLSEEEAILQLQTWKMTAANTGLTASTTSLGNAFKALWSTMVANPLVAVTALVSGAVMVFSGFGRAMEEARQKAKELGDSFKDTSSDIEGYKSKIEELYSTINDSDSSIEDVANARQALMSVQDELIDKFGTEKDVINGVTEAINGQTEALDRLTNIKWQETKNSFDNGGLWDNMGNWLQGYDTNIDRMVDEMENVREILSFSYNDIDSRDFRELKRSLKERGWSYQGTLGGFVKEGNLKEIYSEILEIQTLTEDIEAPGYFLKDLARDANAAKETLDSYGEIWDAYILNDRILANEELADSWRKVNEAYSDYHEAFASGSQEGIDRSLSDYADLMGKVLNNSDIDESVKGYFRNMYSALQAEVEKWEFHAKILPEYDTHALNGKTKADILGMLQTDGMQDGEQTFNSILGLASKYGIITGDNTEKIQQLLDLLVEWGILQDSINESAAGYTVGTTSTITISQTINQLNTRLKPTFDSLHSAYQDIFSDDGQLDLNSIDILSTCDTIKSKLDELNEIEGITVDYSSFEDLVRVLNNTASTESDVENAFDSLATSITQAALSGTEDFETMKAALEDLGVVNNEIVAFAQLAGTTEALEETIAQAGLSMDDFVNATIDGNDATSIAVRNFLAEAVGAEDCGQALALLQLKQVLVNATTINTTDDVNNILALAEAAGYTSGVLSNLARAKASFDTAVANGNVADMAMYDAQIKSYQREVNEDLADWTPTVNWKGTTDGARFAGKAAGRSYKDGLEEELSDLNSVISGVTGRIDDQISVVRSQKEAALESIDAQIDALNEQKSLLESQKKALEEARDAAVEALEEERDARIEVIEQQKKQLEQQIKLIDKQIKNKEKVIKGIQDEIDAMQDANERRKLQINLMKAQYELERLQHERTILQYSEEKGMHYVTDTKDIRDKKQAVDDAKLEIEIANKQKQIDLIEKEIDLLNEKKDAINEQIDLLDEEIDKINEFYDAEIEKVKKFYDGQIKAIDAQIEAIDKQIEAIEKQREHTEKYYESLIGNLEKSKSKYEELTEILEKAELSSKLKQLGIDEEALINGSEEEFNKLKNAYMDVVFKLNEGNADVLSALQKLSGYDGAAPAMLSESNNELDTMNGKLDTANQSVGSVNSSLGETVTTTSDVASNVGDVETSLTEVNSLVTEEQTAFNNLKQTIDEVIEVISQKTQAVQEGQNAVSTATSAEMANFETLKNKIIEVKETLDSISDSVSTLDATPVDNLTTAFQLLYNQLLLVATTLGVGMEEQEDGAVGGITSAIQALNEISLEEGIIAQFTNLKTAIDEVTTAISGGSGDGSSGGEGQGSGSGSKSKGGESGGKGSEGESGGGNSLTGAIKEMGETAKEVIGEPDAEGDGTVIGEFGSMETAVNDVTAAIGSGGSEGGESGEQGSDGGDGTLIGSIIDLGDKTEEELGTSGGDGIIGKFEEFRDVIAEAANQVKSISEGLDEIDGKEVECTITINVKMNGSVPAFASGTVLGDMQIESATYNARYGKAFANGTIGLKKDEKNALRSEYGQPELTVYPDNTTELTTSPTMGDLPKGTVIYNEEQTKKIMDNGHRHGKAYADGTVGGGEVIAPDGRIAEPYDPDKDDSAFSKLYKAWNAYYGDIGNNVDEINKTLSHHLVMEHTQKMNEEVNRFISNGNIVNNTKNVQPVTIQIGDINLTGVQNVDGLAHAIKTRFPNAMLQEIYKR